jgi:valyl-tRNA synthetase
MLEKTYQPAAIEPRVRDDWEKAEAFKAGRPDRASAEPYAIVIPPPNVTGSLHMGHALNNTLQDILCRHRDPDGRRAPDDGAQGAGPARDRPRAVPGKGLGVEG